MYFNSSDEKLLKFRINDLHSEKDIYAIVHNANLLAILLFYIN